MPEAYRVLVDARISVAARSQLSCTPDDVGHTYATVCLRKRMEYFLNVLILLEFVDEGEHFRRLLFR